MELGNFLNATNARLKAQSENRSLPKQTDTNLKNRYSVDDFSYLNSSDVNSNNKNNNKPNYLSDTETEVSETSGSRKIRLKQDGFNFLKSNSKQNVFEKEGKKEKEENEEDEIFKPSTPQGIRPKTARKPNFTHVVDPLRSSYDVPSISTSKEFHEDDSFRPDSAGNSIPDVGLKEMNNEHGDNILRFDSVATYSDGAALRPDDFNDDNNEESKSEPFTESVIDYEQDFETAKSNRSVRSAGAENRGAGAPGPGPARFRIFDGHPGPGPGPVPVFRNEVKSFLIVVVFLEQRIEK